MLYLILPYLSYICWVNQNMNNKQIVRIPFVYYNIETKLHIVFRKLSAYMKKKIPVTHVMDETFNCKNKTIVSTLPNPWFILIKRLGKHARKAVYFWKDCWTEIWRVQSLMSHYFYVTDKLFLTVFASGVTDTIVYWLKYGTQ